MDNTKEYIICAALKRITPKNTNSYHHNDIDLIEIGYRHHDIRNRFLGEVSCSPKNQGFYTSHGRFVSRSEAMQIAFECGQLKDRDPLTIFHINEKNGEKIWHDLFSEDLY